LGLLSSLIVLSLLIFFHELGHFLAARFFGVQVDVFSIGFGKRLYTKKIGTTEYSISAIPLGGYVKMKGQDDSKPLAMVEGADSYSSKAPWQRMVILFAGPLANFLLAFFIYIAIGIMGERVLSPTIGEIKTDFPAAVAGIESGDKVISINGIEIKSWKELSEIIKVSSSDLVFIIDRNGIGKEFVVTPKMSDSKNLFGEVIYKPMIGILPSGEVDIIQHDFIDAIPFAFDKTIEDATMIVLGIQKLIEGVVSPTEIGGVISIVQITSEASMMGMLALLTFTALISVNLGVLNLLPIPALDGGHMIFTLYEMLFSRKPSENVLYRLTVGGWAILFCLMFLGLYNDINRLITGGSVLP